MVSRISILVFPQVQDLDFTGPLEVFSCAARNWPGVSPRIEIVALDPAPLQTVGGLTITPHRSIADCLHTDLLVLPGGRGTRPALRQPELIHWIRERHRQAKLTLSVCSGALLLAKAGILTNRHVTTHHDVFEELTAIAPHARIERTQRYVDTGDLITAAGISAGIDAALYTVSRLVGPQIAHQTATYMEYDWAG